jgi:hypothetical protein
MIALAQAGFAHGLPAWSQSAGGFGEAARSAGVGVGGAGAECEANPPRVPIMTILAGGGGASLVLV